MFVFISSIAMSDSDLTYLHAERIVLDIIKGTSELDSLFKVNIERIVSSIVQLSNVNLIHLSANNWSFLSLNKHRLLIHHHVAVDVDVVKDNVRDPDLFVQFGGERVLLVVLFQVLKLEVLIKPLNMNHEMDIKCSLHVIDFE